MSRTPIYQNNYQTISHKIGERTIIYRKGPTLGFKNYEFIPNLVTFDFEHDVNVAKNLTHSIPKDHGVVENSTIGLTTLQKQVLKEHPYETVNTKKGSDVSTENSDDENSYEEDPENEVRKLSCRIKTGCFCCGKCSREDKRLEQMGIGMIVYYKFMKTMFFIFTIVSILNIYLLYNKSN